MPTASEDEASALPRWFTAGFVGLCLLSLLVLIAAGLDSQSRFSFAWRCDSRDAVTYYFAALGPLEGISPYDRPAIAERFNEFPHFVYPLFSLPLFLPMAAFDLETALLVYGLAHLLAFAGLILIWRRLLSIDWRLMAVLLPVGLGATSVHDLCSNNVVFFEAFFLWLGIGALWRDRLGRFGLWIAIAAVPKLLWLSLLPLALWRSLRAWRVLAYIALAALESFALWLAAWPETFWQWLLNVRVTTSFRLNVFTMLRNLDKLLGGEVGGDRLLRWETWAYVLWIALVAGFFLLALRRRIGLRSLSLLAPLTLLAVWPGSLSYSWLPLVPIAAVVIFFLAARRRYFSALGLTLLCVLPQPFFIVLGFNHAFGQGTMITVLVFWAVLTGIVLRQGDNLEEWLGGRRGRAMPAEHGC